MDINLMANKLAAKWVCRDVESDECWALLIKRNCAMFQLKDLKVWTSFGCIKIFLSNRKLAYKGSELEKGLWNAWDSYRGELSIKPSPRAISVSMGVESL